MFLKEPNFFISFSANFRKEIALEQSTVQKGTLLNAEECFFSGMLIEAAAATILENSKKRTSFFPDEDAILRDSLMELAKPSQSALGKFQTGRPDGMEGIDLPILVIVG